VYCCVVFVPLSVLGPLCYDSGEVGLGSCGSVATRLHGLRVLHFKLVRTVEVSMQQRSPSRAQRLRARCIVSKSLAGHSASVSLNPVPDVCPPCPVPACVLSQGGKSEIRRVRIPAHRYTPLKDNWAALMTPVVEHLKLQIRMNTKTRMVELKVC
jgi:hypothetical protein